MVLPIKATSDQGGHLCVEMSILLDILMSSVVF